jgi:putative DNA primase/helicase
MPRDPDLSHLVLRDAYLHHHPNTCYGLGDWRRYQAGHWPVIDGHVIKREIQAVAEAETSKGLAVNFTSGLVNSVHDLLTSRTFVPSDQFDANTDLIVLADCALELSTQQVVSHSPAHYATTKVPYRYDPEARSEAWEKVLALLPDCHDFLQEFAALSTTTRTDLETAVWFYGPPGCGKSTFISGLEAMLGDRCGTLSLEDIESSNFGLASLPGKTLVTATEQPASCLGSVHTLNKIISGEPTTIQRKYRDAYTLRPYAKVLWAANELPRVTSKGVGLFRRVKVVKFPALAIEDRNPRIKEEVLASGMAVLNWTLAGYPRLIKRGRLLIPASVEEATEQYRQENDAIQMFVDERCVSDPNGRVKGSEIYSSYNRWCGSNGYNPENSTNFGRHLGMLGYEPIRSNGVYRLGLRLKVQDEDETNEILDSYCGTVGTPKE